MKAQVEKHRQQKQEEEEFIKQQQELWEEEERERKKQISAREITKFRQRVSYQILHDKHHIIREKCHKGHFYKRIIGK